MPHREPPRLGLLGSQAMAQPYTPPATLAETVDHLIARGVVLKGEIAIAVAGTDLVRFDLSAVLRAAVRPVPPRPRAPETEVP